MALILLVDDDEVARHIVRRMLERAGHRVEEAGDGEAAVAALEGGLVPDCMVLDLMMPRMGGVDVLRRVRGDARWQNVPVVLMTALDQGAEVESARQMGFRRHFLKAYWHADDLLKAINHSVPGATSVPAIPPTVATVTATATATVPTAAVAN
jgi:CheY-like chemotaxis protein